MEEKLDKILNHLMDLKVDVALVKTQVNRNTADLVKNTKSTRALEESMDVALLHVKIIRWLPKVSAAVIAVLGIIKGVMHWRA